MRLRSLVIPALCFAVLSAGLVAQRLVRGRNQAAELAALQASYAKAEEDFIERWSTARTNAERERLSLDTRQYPAHAFLPKFQDLAKRARGTETAAQALFWILQHARTAGQREAAETAAQDLLDDHLDSPVIVKVASRLQDAYGGVSVDRFRSALQTIAAGSRRREARAAALFHLACLRMATEPGTPERRAAIRRLFDRVQNEYGDTQYGNWAGGRIFAMEHLAIGTPAADFAATDQDGRSFRLSDYRGQVVVLDFWVFS